MKETYLHLLWKQKRIPFHKMHLTTGKTFRVVHSGNYNRTESGPDFSDAKIEIDGILWCGSVEIHVRSSDWYKHGHHRDPVYSTVILHVVLIHDREVFIGEEKLPVLELRAAIEWSHSKKYIQFSGLQKKMPCQSCISTIDRVFIRSMLEKCAIERIQRKIVQFGNPWEDLSPSYIFFKLLCGAFGQKVNTQPFSELAVRIPFHIYKKLNQEDRKNMIVATSGLDKLQEERLATSANRLKETHRLGINETVNPVSWKRKGLRPTSDPMKRIEQLARFASVINYEAFEMNTHEELLLEQLRNAFDSSNFSSDVSVLKLSAGLFQQILINAFVPFLFLRESVSQDNSNTRYGLDLLDKLAPEKNNITAYWSGIGFIPQTALESQGLLELDKRYCQLKKCLNCTIGIKVLAG